MVFFENLAAVLGIDDFTVRMLLLQTADEDLPFDHFIICN